MSYILKFSLYDANQEFICTIPILFDDRLYNLGIANYNGTFEPNSIDSIVDGLNDIKNYFINSESAVSEILGLNAPMPPTYPTGYGTIYQSAFLASVVSTGFCSGRYPISSISSSQEVYALDGSSAGYLYIRVSGDTTYLYWLPSSSSSSSNAAYSSRCVSTVGSTTLDEIHFLVYPESYIVDGIVTIPTNLIYAGTRSGFFFNFINSGSNSAYVANWASINALNMANILNGSEVSDIESSDDPFTPNPTGPGGYSGTSQGGDGTGGGFGDFDYHSDNVGASETPTISASDSGMLTIHCGDISYLQALSAYLWAGAFDPNNWKKLFADPMDCILGCHMIPFQPVTHAGVITVGNISTGVAMPVANNQFQSRDCGSINITSQSLSHSFMDFLPYLKCSLYLPFIGIVPINSDDVIDKTLHIKYICDILSGTVLAQVESNNNLVYQYSGNFATEIPITAGQFANGYQTLLKAGQIAMGGFVNAVGASQSAQKAPNAIGAAAAIVGGVVETNNTINDLATNIMASLKPVITRSGGISGTSGFMAQKYPYVIVEAPNLAVPKSQNYYTGYMQYETINLGSISGYTEILAAHLDGITATNDEKAEIMNILKSGVML